MPITIDVRQGSDGTALAMLVATVSLAVAAIAQVVVAFMQARAASRQAEAAAEQTKAAYEQAKAAQKMIEVSLMQLREAMASADNATMPSLELRRVSRIGVTNDLLRLVIGNGGSGPALDLKIIDSKASSPILTAPTKPLRASLAQGIEFDVDIRRVVSPVMVSC
jgi:outer membrane protein TolC